MNEENKEDRDVLMVKVMIIVIGASAIVGGFILFYMEGKAL